MPRGHKIKIGGHLAKGKPLNWFPGVKIVANTVDVAIANYRKKQEWKKKGKPLAEGTTLHERFSKKKFIYKHGKINEM